MPAGPGGVSDQDPAVQSVHRHIQNADQILVVDDGCIAQAGTHQELIAREGIYQSFTRIRQKAEAWQIQEARS